VTSAGNKRKPVSWNPADYAANSASQQAWARELIARLKFRGGERILDVGCGDGKVTAEIARAVPQGVATGIDASPEMIAFARKAFPKSQIPNLKFEVMDARQINAGGLQRSAAVSAAARGEGHNRTNLPSADPSEAAAGGTPALRCSGKMAAVSSSKNLAPLVRSEGGPGEPFDIVFSNAALHWVDDHPAFLRGVASCLRSGGRLLVSCGGTGNAQEVFVALRAEMRLKRWREFFRQLERPYFFHSPEEYERWLPRFGFQSLGVRLADKDMIFETRENFTGWFRTTWLPYTQRVPEALREEFIAAVVGRYLAKHPADRAERVRVRMVRLEIEAIRL
jgi:trans-aconitate methyltransferase